MSTTNENQIELEIEDIPIDGEDSENTDMKEPFNPNEINIITKQDTLYTLINRLKYNEIDMNTDFQRHADLWDSTKMSRLIESILIRLPIPAFYFDASDENNWLIVDGLQRLSSIRKFVVEEYSSKQLRLRNLEYLIELNGKTYKELSRMHQRRIDECPVTLFLIQSGTPKPVKYSIFKRINTGGLVLKDQEIRNAMLKPTIRNFLENLAKYEYLIKTMGDQSKRMLNQEIVLRFLAIYYKDYQKSKVSIKNFLDEMADELEKLKKSELDDYEQTYKIALKRCWLVFGNNAFEKNQIEGKTKKRTRKNVPLFEVWTTALVKLNDSDFKKLENLKDILIKKHNELMANDNQYFDSITYSTHKRDHYRIRHDTVHRLIQEVIND